ncbi:MAG TPA: ferredoxin-thioredoxin reductase catalytic domain-containing protein [Candidatus Nanoarchaeia archaeon]|nr:ferredoxin-thioredoxin reductase catalytic domain-containing protein [Candidatus Nanoarchaeia archaeon]
MGEVEKLIEAWNRYAKNFNAANEANKFVLNPDRERVKRLARGVLSNEKNHGLKYCPCRLSTGEREKDLLLICPCNFFIQQTWKEKGECWCSLFVRA